MALTEFEEALVEVCVGEFIERRRPPENLRDEVDLTYKIDRQSVIILEKRPTFRDPSRIIEHAVAKTTFTQTSKRWKIYWQRADLKWHRYDPVPEVRTLDEFIAIVDEDEHGCFWG